MGDRSKKKQMFDWNTCKNIADFFANIVDYKSPFTSRHSIGVAEKAAQFAKYIGYDVLDIEKCIWREHCMISENGGR